MNKKGEKGAFPLIPVIVALILAVIGFASGFFVKYKIESILSSVPIWAWWVIIFILIIILLPKRK